MGHKAYGIDFGSNTIKVYRKVASSLTSSDFTFSKYTTSKVIKVRLLNIFCAIILPHEAAGVKVKWYLLWLLYLLLWGLLLPTTKSTT